MIEGIGFILLGILAMSAPTLAIMIIYGLFKLGEVVSTYLDLKIVEMKKEIEER